MEKLYKQQKVCSFYISSMHLVTMLLPYINKEKKDEREIITFFEYNLENNIKKVLENVIIDEETRKNILKVRWEDKKIYKYSNFEKYMKSLIKEKNDIIVSGSEEYINIINMHIDEYIKKNYQKISNKEIKIVDCYEVEEFNKNISEVLDSHDLIFNTSGEHEIDEIFEGYTKKQAY